MKENQHVKPVINVEAGTVDFIVKGHSNILFDIAKVHPDLIRRAALVGFAQVRIVDRAAVGMTDDDGNILSEDERIAIKHERMAELVEHLHTGTAEWNIVGAAGGGKSLTIEAIAKVKGWDYETAKKYVEDFASKERQMPDGKKMSFGGDVRKTLAYFASGETVRKTMNEIKASRQTAPKVDADAALKELGE